jgi:hypothetical protein
MESNSYSNPNNTFEERVEFLEDTIGAIVKNLIHLGADVTGITSMPIEQWIAREYLKQKGIT